MAAKTDRRPTWQQIADDLEPQTKAVLAYILPLLGDPEESAGKVADALADLQIGTVKIVLKRVAPDREL